MTDENKPQGNSDWLKTFGINVQDTVNCEVPQCVAEATHYMQFKCCQQVFIACQEHISSFIHQIRVMANRGGMLNCGHCNQRSLPSNFITRPMNLDLTEAS